jgi:TonB-dependent SusC/RagA subfamily outer membrane receptor
LAVLLASSGVAAQTPESCPSGPGAAFGISAYQCANCGYRQGERPTYSFLAEPVVVETNRATGISAGDVIEAVNGKPITTSAGAQEFTYPPGGSNKIAIRRGRERQVLDVSVPFTCGFTEGRRRTRFSLNDIENVEVLKGSAAMRYGQDAAAGVVVVTTRAASPASAPLADTTRLRLLEEFSEATNRQRGSDPLLVIDGVVIGRTLPKPSAPPAGRFGFGLNCEPSCTVWTGRDGPLIYTYHKYSVLPAVTAIGRASPAERAGVKVGDVVMKVDGHSVLDDEGAKGLARLERVDVVRLTVRRDGKEIEFTLRADR